MSPGTILGLLRERTGAMHARLEHRVAIEARLRDPVQYSLLLERFFGWYVPMEARLSALGEWGRWGVDTGARMHKSEWLAQDLRALGHSPQAIAQLPRCEKLPDIWTFARGMGCDYVLEGATLGGRHIVALLARSPVPPQAWTFFSSYGDQTGNRWREFTEALERYGSTSGAAEEMASGAVDTFDSLEAWMATP
jgi:heme oxygenase (biliverdin-IX-beta and delta-forming)